MEHDALPQDEAQAAEALIGTTLAERYRVEALLGVGGMGAVYRATHVAMQKTVALKVLHAEMAEVPEMVARFEREAVTAARVTHPNLAAALDFGKLPDGSLYLVMEFVPGQVLRDVLGAGALPPERVVRIGIQIASALEAAHAASIVHRDLKPENVILRDGDEQVKVLDLGIAKVPVEESKGGRPLTRVGAVLGTPQYMAPEQAIGGKVDHRTDLYALGVVLYEMAAGVAPFSDDDGASAVIARHITEKPPPLPASVPERLAALILQLLEKSAADRPQSATEVIQRLKAAIDQPAAALASPAVTQQLESPAPERPASRVKPWVVLAAAGVALVAVGAFMASALGGDEGAPRAGPSTPPAASTAPATPVARPAARPEPVKASPSSAPAPAAAATTSRPPSTKPSKPARGKGRKKEERKTGPGGIYIPPPEDWF